MLTPCYFIPNIQNTHLIEKLDFYVLEKAFDQINRLKSEGLSISVAINLTGMTFLMDNFVDRFKELFFTKKPDPSLVKIELTESIALSNAQVVKSHMLELDKLGIVFSMDDFGIGYSSVLNLKQFPFSNIKLDANFVMDYQKQKESETISTKLLDMLSALNFKTTAEGVENEYLFFAFSYLPCTFLQGYYISKPLRFDKFVDFVKNFKVRQEFLSIKSNTDKRLTNPLLIRIKYNLYNYLKNTKELIDKNFTSNDFDSFLKLSHSECEFGKLHHTLEPAYLNLGSFKNVEDLHALLHIINKQLLSSKNTDLYKNILITTIKLNNALDTLSLEAALSI